MSEDGVTKQHVGGPEPRIVRASCRERFYNGLQMASDCIDDEEAKYADRIRALDTLGRFGLGAADQAQIHLHGDVGSLNVGVVHLPALDVVQDEPNEGGQEASEEERKLLGAGKVPT